MSRRANWKKAFQVSYCWPTLATPPDIDDQPLPPRFKLLKHTSFVLTLELDIAGKRLISGGAEHSIHVWNFETGDFIKTLHGHLNEVKALKIMHTRAFGTGGTMLLSGWHDGILNAWDLDSGDCLTTISGFEQGVRTIDYCKSDPDIVVAGSYDGAIRVARLSTGQIERVIKGHSGYVFAVRLFKNDTQIVSASGDKTVRFWDYLTGRQTALIPAHTGMIISLDISADETLLATGSDDNQVTVWDLNTRAKIASFTAGEWVYSVQILHNKYVLAGEYRRTTNGKTADCSIRVWNIATSTMVSGFIGGCVWQCKYARGVLASCSTDKTVRVWRFPEQLPYTPAPASG